MLQSSTCSPPTSLANDAALTQCHAESPADGPRFDLLEEYRRRRAEVFRANRVAKDAANTASIVEEWASEAETQFARVLRRTGPVVVDGRHYSARKCDGVLRVEVRSADGGDM